MWWDLSLPPAKQATEVSGLYICAVYAAMFHDGMRVVLASGNDVQVLDAASSDSSLSLLGGVPGDAEGLYIGRPRELEVSCLATTGDGK